MNNLSDLPLLIDSRSKCAPGLRGCGIPLMSISFMSSFMLSSVAMVSLKIGRQKLTIQRLEQQFILANCLIPKVEDEEHQEVEGLSDECWFVSN